ncbi:hypothetical protein BDGGKGIB_01066 [Nodularia sphaerocarpa UHCC 0038]|nr:hypothetical protein BDGGKGIB_01066 [Nodularia sphaerocarpa UHCC 0038]
MGGAGGGVHFFSTVLAAQSYSPSPLLAPPEIPPQRGEEKDKPLIWEGLGVGFIHLKEGM